MRTVTQRDRAPGRTRGDDRLLSAHQMVTNPQYAGRAISATAFEAQAICPTRTLRSPPWVYAITFWDIGGRRGSPHSATDSKKMSDKNQYVLDSSGPRPTQQDHAPAWAVRSASLERFGGVRDCPRFGSRAPTRQPRRRKGMSAIPEHGLSDAKHKEINGILPAAVRRSKQPSVA
jgi:hypothetical protein